MKSSAKRNDSIISRKLIQFIIPAFGTAIAISLNEFVDSILVAQLLGSEAMAVVNVGAPVMIFAACIYCLFGFGGNILYAKAIGDKDSSFANRVLVTAVPLSFLTGLVFMLLGLVFRVPLAAVLTGGSSLASDFESYSVFLFISVPLISLVMTFSTILPAMNHPVLGSICVVIANTVNLALDYVFISVLKLGVSGASLATLSGYVCALVFLIVIIVFKKVEIPRFSRNGSARKKVISDIVRAGTADALLQFGYSIAWGVCNSIAAAVGGDDGLVTFSFFMQLWSIISIFLEGVCDGGLPLYSLLYGTDDRRGVVMLAVRSAILLEIFSIALVVYFMLFPQHLFIVFSIDSPIQQELCISAINAFAVFAPVRCLIIAYREILNSCGREKYASVLAVLDSIVGTILFSVIGVIRFGVNGLWYAYIFNVLFMILAIVCVNLIIYFRSDRKTSAVFLFDNSAPDVIFDATVTNSSSYMTEMSEKVITECRNSGIPAELSTFAGLLVEEMTVYTWNHCGEKTYIDILVRKTDSGVKLDYRSIGRPFNPLTENEMDEHINVRLIQVLSKDLKYEYALGLNTTTVVLEDKDRMSDK